MMGSGDCVVMTFHQSHVGGPMVDYMTQAVSIIPVDVVISPDQLVGLELISAPVIT